jgi:hypothetical protein
VKVRHDEGVANHIGPEPCVAVRKDVDEASVGEGIGQSRPARLEGVGERGGTPLAVRLPGRLPGTVYRMSTAASAAVSDDDRSRFQPSRGAHQWWFRFR